MARIRSGQAPAWFTSVRRWFTIGGIPALPIRPAMRLRIDHALTDGRPCHIG